MANIGKNAKGFGYKYTDLAEINNYLESIGYTYYQYIDTIDGIDYIYTVPIKGGKEYPPRRGCRIVKAVLSGVGGTVKENPVQEYGSAITYARRYSLLMAFGLATTDDDGACFTSTRPAKPQARSTRNETEKKPMQKETPKTKEVSENKNDYDDYLDNMAASYADESLMFYLNNPEISNVEPEETDIPEFNPKLSSKEVMLLKNLCTRKGLDVRNTFPKGIDALTPEMYAAAVKRLTKLPDLSFS